MILIDDLMAMAWARLDDVQVLWENGRFDAARYLCGYIVELALKARICRTLGWKGFPDSRSEFENLTSFKTHRLDVLLSLSGQEQRIKAEALREWSEVASWDPELRYHVVGEAERERVVAMMIASATLLKVI